MACLHGCLLHASLRVSLSCSRWLLLLWLLPVVPQLHGSYEALHTGSAAEAIVDLTGGSVQKIHLNECEWQC